MPRKYHRPPATKRRKSRKSTTPKVFEPLPESQTDNAAATMRPTESAVDDETAETEVPQETTEDQADEVWGDDEEDEEEEELPAFARTSRRTQVRHLVADYSYVLTEVRLALGLAVFLIVALVVTGILR